MINLLPDDTKRDIKAARMNVTLLRYNFFTLFAIIILAAFCFMFYILLRATQSNAETTSNDNNIKAAAYSDVRKEAEDYRNNLAIASKVIDKGADYTSTIFAITELLPEGVILDGINLNATDFGQQTAFSAHAKNYTQASKLKENFQSSKLFSNVYFQNLSEGSASGSTAGSNYPITITISAKLNKVGS
mgnify:CR=1 FL=1